MRGEAISVLSLEGRYHNLLHTLILVPLWLYLGQNLGQRQIERDKKRYQ